MGPICCLKSLCGSINIPHLWVTRSIKHLPLSIFHINTLSLSFPQAMPSFQLVVSKAIYVYFFYSFTVSRTRSPRSCNSYIWCTHSPLAIACQFILCPKPTHCIKWFLCLCFTLIITTLCPPVITLNWLLFSSLSERLRKILLSSLSISPLVYSLTVLSWLREHSPSSAFPIVHPVFLGEPLLASLSPDTGENWGVEGVL